MELILCYFVQSLGSPFNVLGPKSRNYGGVEGWRGVEGGGPPQAAKERQEALRKSRA